MNNVELAKYVHDKLLPEKIRKAVPLPLMNDSFYNIIRTAVRPERRATESEKLFADVCFRVFFGREAETKHDRWIQAIRPFPTIFDTLCEIICRSYFVIENSLQNRLEKHCDTMLRIFRFYMHYAVLDRAHRSVNHEKMLLLAKSLRENMTALNYTSLREKLKTLTLSGWSGNISDSIAADLNFAPKVLSCQVAREAIASALLWGSGRAVDPTVKYALEMVDPDSMHTFKASVANLVLVMYPPFYPDTSSSSFLTKRNAFAAHRRWNRMVLPRHISEETLFREKNDGFMLNYGTSDAFLMFGTYNLNAILNFIVYNFSFQGEEKPIKQKDKAIMCPEIGLEATRRSLARAWKPLEKITPSREDLSTMFKDFQAKRIIADYESQVLPWIRSDGDDDFELFKLGGSDSQSDSDDSDDEREDGRSRSDSSGAAVTGARVESDEADGTPESVTVNTGETNAGVHVDDSDVEIVAGDGEGAGAGHVAGVVTSLGDGRVFDGSEGDQSGKKRRAKPLELVSVAKTPVDTAAPANPRERQSEAAVVAPEPNAKSPIGVLHRDVVDFASSTT
ncbi:Hypothetical Protein FCC1311_090092, partial [Hondaea fermentalgiana]